MGQGCKSRRGMGRSTGHRDKDTSGVIVREMQLLFSGRADGTERRTARFASFKLVGACSAAATWNAESRWQRSERLSGGAWRPCVPVRAP